MSNTEYPALPYLPSSVRVVHEADGFWYVINDDGSYYRAAPTQGAAERIANVRRGVIQAAITRRANKAAARRQEARRSACEDNGVTWNFLREELSVAEADAWLGLD